MRSGFWLRDGEFDATPEYDEDEIQITYKYCKVTSIPYPIKALVTYLPVTDFESLVINFVVSPLYYSELSDLARENFSEVKTGIDDQTFFIGVRIVRETTNNFLKFINSHPDLKAQFMDTEIIDEFREIARCIENISTIRSVVRTVDRTKEEEFVRLLNPLRSKPKTLSKYIKKYEEEDMTADDFKRIHTELARGADPNQGTDQATSLLKSVIVNYKPQYKMRLVKLFLFYNISLLADPDGYTLLELAYFKNEFQIANILISQFTKPIKPPTLNTRLLKVDTHQIKDQIETCFDFPACSLRSTLKFMSDLTHEERIGLEDLYRKNFDDKDENSIFSNAENKFVEIIKNTDGKIVGVVISIVRKENQNVYCNIDLELFDTEHNNFGLMPAITYKFPFALQKLFPDCIIWVVFFAAHESSINRVRDQFGTPKYEAEGLVDEVVDVLRRLFGYEIELNNSDVTECYIKEKKPAVVKVEHQTQIPSLIKYFFDLWRKNDGTVSMDQIKMRDVLVALPISIEFLQTLQNISASKGLNFYRLVCDLARELKAKQYDPATPSFFHGRGLFFERKMTLAPTKMHIKLAQEPPHRSNTHSSM